MNLKVGGLESLRDGGPRVWELREWDEAVYYDIVGY